jgi:hypothetical protein
MLDGYGLATAGVELHPMPQNDASATVIGVVLLKVVAAAAPPIHEAPASAITATSTPTESSAKRECRDLIVLPCSPHDRRSSASRPVEID